MISAFGVEHGEEVSKAFGMAPMKMVGQAAGNVLRRGNSAVANKVPGAMGSNMRSSVKARGRQAASKQRAGISAYNRKNAGRRGSGRISQRSLGRTY